MTNLIQSAINAKDFSYAPYSHFRVGAAVLTDDGNIFTGANIENASYGATNCAERTAIFKAVSERRVSGKFITAIAISADNVYAMPCGICRQVLSEFATENASVIVVKTLDDYREFSLHEIFPFSFELPC